MTGLVTCIMEDGAVIVDVVDVVDAGVVDMEDAVAIAALLVWDSGMEHGEDMGMEDVGMEAVVGVAAGDAGDVEDAEDVVVDCSDQSLPRMQRNKQNSRTNNPKTALNLLKMTNQHLMLVRRKRRRVKGVDFGKVAADVDVEHLET